MYSDKVQPKWKDYQIPLNDQNYTINNGFQTIKFDSFLEKHNYLVKPTDYKPCPGLKRHKVFDDQKLEIVLDLVQKVLLKKMDEVGFEYEIYKTNETYDKDFAFNLLD